MINYFEDLKNGAYQVTPIAYVSSPFKSKFGVPKQPSLAKSIEGEIVFKNDPHLLTAVKALDGYSHLWVVFVFHAHGGKNWKPSIRPPRLGGRTKVGVLSSRSPHRPNPIGISVVKIEGIVINSDRNFKIKISGMDLIDGTPVLDIKPYLPYTDAVADARVGWAAGDNQVYTVTFSQKALSEIDKLKNAPEMRSMIQQVLELDPRPAYQQRENPISSSLSNGLSYGIEISGLEVKYTVKNGGLYVKSVSKSN